MLERLQHPHILHILDVGIQNGFPYLVMEYCSSGSLRRRLKRQGPGLLPVEEALIILAQVGEALEYVHQCTIVHRDLKPENILFNGKEEALLADFGIAKMLATIGVQQGTITGTPAYMAPEQFRGIASREGDQYALGCIAYELLTGRKPFTAPDMVSMMYKHVNEQPVAPRDLNPQLPVHIQQAILTAMAKEREARYADVATFMRAFQKTAQQWLDEGDSLYQHKRYEKALVAYEQAIRLDPNDATVYNSKGNILNELKRYQEALVALEQAIRLDPNNADAYMNKGYTLNELKRYQEALVALEQAIRLDPNNADAYNDKGNALCGLKRYEEALAAYEQAIQLDPNDTIFHNNKRNTLKLFEGSKEDEQVHEKSPTTWLQRIAKWSQEPVVVDEKAQRLNEGNAPRGLKRYEEALAAYEQAIRLNPNLALAYVGKGNILNDLKRYEEALAAYEQALRLDPNLALAYYNKGIALDALGKKREAQQAYERARQLGYDG